MKPLLIIPPCARRWPALSDLYAHETSLRLTDVEKRFFASVQGGQDAFAVIPDGGRMLSGALLSKRGETGVLSLLYTRPEHRKRGHAGKLVATLLEWFTLTGGKRLYLTSPSNIAAVLFEKHTFKVLRQFASVEGEQVTMIHTARGAPGNPYEQVEGEAAIRDVSRADWPLLVELLQHCSGPDPRISLDESAVAAETVVLDLVDQNERGVSHLQASMRNDRMVALASVATDRIGDRTHAMIMPHDARDTKLREAVIAFAAAKEYAHVDFPMEALSGEDGTVDERR